MGTCNIELSKILQSPIRQTPQSFVRVFDAFLPVDDVNETGKRIALLRVIIYLEDLGPVDYLKQTEANFREKVGDFVGTMPIVPPEINMRHEDDGEKVRNVRLLFNDRLPC